MLLSCAKLGGLLDILFDDPSNHDDNEALELIQQLVTNGRTTILCTGNNQRGINGTV